MLSGLPNWLQMILSLAILGFVVAVGSRVSQKVTSKVIKI